MRAFCLFLLFAASSFGQTGNLVTRVESGTIFDTAGAVRSTSFTLNPNNPTGLGAQYIDGEMSRVPIANLSYQLSGVKLTLQTSVTGSTSSQSVNVSSTIGLDALHDDYLIIDGGTSAQEVVKTSSITDDTHFAAIVRNNHSSGAVVQAVFSSYQQRFKATTASPYSVGGMTNVGFIRFGSLPSNVFEQYRTDVSCSPLEDDPIPWFSDASNTYAVMPQYDPISGLTSTGNSSNAVLLNAGPITTTTILTCIEVQRIFTVSPEPYIGGVFHRYVWDY